MLYDVCVYTGIDIFYQLCSSDTRGQYHLGAASSYAYLNQSNNLTIDGVDDAAEFGEVVNGMDELHFKPEEKTAIFTIVAWILHLGNLRFRETGEKKCVIDNHHDLQYIAKLMEVDEAALIKAITYRVMVVRGQAPMDIGLGVAEAQAARDALAKFVYARLFDWYVMPCCPACDWHDFCSVIHVCVC